MQTRVLRCEHARTIEVIEALRAIVVPIVAIATWSASTTRPVTSHIGSIRRTCT